MLSQNRPDFTDNSSWFNWKILTDGSLDNNVKELGRRTYTEMMRKILRELNIHSKHFGHFGRVNGPVELEFEEVSQEFIRILGKRVFDCRVFWSIDSHSFSPFRQLGPEDSGESLLREATRPGPSGHGWVRIDGACLPGKGTCGPFPGAAIHALPFRGGRAGEDRYVS